MPTTFRSATRSDVLLIQDLAHRIWHECYPGIITTAQIDYMLERRYAPGQLESDFQGGIRMDLAYREGEAVGFSGYGPAERDGEMKLHKLYVLASQRRHGIGRALLTRALEWGLKEGFESLCLLVNKRNVNAIAAYQRYGMEVREAVVTEIGRGFVMDDYTMAAPIRVLLRTSGTVSAGSE